MSTIWNKPRYHSPLNDTIALLLSEVQALTQALTDWSQGNSTAAKVRDAQGRMDKAYTKCIADFVKCEISMRNLGDLPEDLQELLGPLLSSEPTPEHLETYLPDIQSTTTRFIQDLHTKRREHYQRRRSTSSLCMDPRFELKRAQTLGSLVTDKRVPKQCPRCDGNVEGWTQYQREKALCCLGGSVRRGRAIFEGWALKSDGGNFQGGAPVIRRASLQSNIPLRSDTPIQGDNLHKGNTPTKINTSPKRDTPSQGDTPPKGGTLSRNNVPPLSDLPQDSSSASTLVDRTPVPAVSNDIRALGRGENGRWTEGCT
ncbi:hypothetical protein BDV93DRAFT_554395 [Ceratobasidium sp. AG-I]|nr:hypothetical protein BDV93DRAFT_554395 [Ceratobasidium sp. AG-I]